MSHTLITFCYDIFPYTTTSDTFNVRKTVDQILIKLSTVKELFFALTAMHFKCYSCVVEMILNEIWQEWLPS